MLVLNSNHYHSVRSVRGTDGILVRSGRISLSRVLVRSTPGKNTVNSNVWTPFDHMQDEEDSRHPSRMIETQRGEVDDVSPKVEEGQECCEYCHGTGLVVCEYCRGTSRVNYVENVTVPKGEWPMWCTKCIRCSGKTVCGFCLGCGKKREPIGFRV